MSKLILLSFVFVLGTCAGSFLNCVIYRLQVKKSFWKGRSFCPKCNHVLNCKDLIPVLSFFLLKGKCRYCKKRISWQHPLVEAAAGILFVLITNHFVSQFPIDNSQLLFIIYYLLIACFLIIIFVYDLKHYLIPDRIIYPAILVSSIWYLVSSIFFNSYTKYEILNTLYAAIGAAGFFLLIVLVSRGKWMGMGDVKMAFFMGIFLGFPHILPALFSAFLIGAIIGTGLVVFDKKTLRSEVPFGPFLVTGTFVAMFFGERMINWYLSLLNLTF